MREQKCPSCGNVMDFITIGKDALDDMIIKCPRCLRITVVEDNNARNQPKEVSNHS